MALDIKRFSGNIGTGGYAPAVRTYFSGEDVEATVVAANYFLDLHLTLKVGDFIFAHTKDTMCLLAVTEATSTSVKTVKLSGGASAPVK